MQSDTRPTAAEIAARAELDAEAGGLTDSEAAILLKEEAAWLRLVQRAKAGISGP